MRYDRLVAGLFVSSSALFVLSGIGSVWASAERPQAWLRYLVLALGPALAYLVWWVGTHDEDGLGKSGFVAALLAAALAAAYLSGRLAPSEAVAGSLVALIPLGGAGSVWSRATNRRVPFTVGLIALSVAGVGLAVTGERSAWFALAMGALVAVAFAWRFDDARRSWFRLVVDIAAVVAVLAVMSGVALLVRNPAMLDSIARAVGDSDYGRVRTWQDGLQLAEDYLYSGIGFGQTGMALSTYVYLFHVPFVFQVYNLYLQVALEQGLPGLIGLTGILVAGIWRAVIALRGDRRAVKLCAACVLAALFGVGVHGLFDAGVYVSFMSFALFVPSGFALGLMLDDRDAADARRGSIWGRSFALGAFAPWGVVAVLLLSTGAKSTWLANLASVEQTRSELAAYSWPEWYIQDDVRRTGAVSLENVTARFETALTFDPDNVTAHRRLGQIAVSTGDLKSAIEHLEVANARAPEQRTTRQLLGEVYAVTGDVDRAVEVWSSGTTDPHKLELRQAWYLEKGERRQSGWLGEAVRRLSIGSERTQ